MKTLQDIFDEAFIKLIAQGQTTAVYGSKVPCQYVRADGCRCIVGGLLPVDVNTRMFEGLGVNYMNEDERDEPISYKDQQGLELLRLALLRSGINTNDLKVRELLVWMQSAHDGIGPGPHLFRHRIRSRVEFVAGSMGLNMAKVVAKLKEVGI